GAPPVAAGAVKLTVAWPSPAVAAASVGTPGGNANAAKPGCGLRPPASIVKSPPTTRPAVGETATARTAPSASGSQLVASPVPVSMAAGGGGGFAPLTAVKSPATYRVGSERASANTAWLTSGSQGVTPPAVPGMSSNAARCCRGVATPTEVNEPPA